MKAIGFISMLFFLLLTSAFCTESQKYWVFFADKGENETKGIGQQAMQKLSPRSVSRRANLGIPLDIYDVPVSDDYIRQVKALGAQIVHRSRWLNAISIKCDETVLASVEALPFVSHIRRVSVFRSPEQKPNIINWRGAVENDYGLSLAQAEAVGADIMQQLGFNGEGIIIGMLDSGFDIYQTVFDSLLAEGRIVAKYDFVHNDTSLGYDTLAGDWDFAGFQHGTMTLSCIAANAPGTMMGIAPHSSFALAKTEITDTLGDGYERIIEEDNWVAGAEWCDSVGVDIISSSLGYSTFDDGFGYVFGQLNGDIAVTTVAADIAASRGIAVFNSAGNERNTSWGHLVTPADGDSVCAVGATTSDGWFAYFSSPGPTYDGRTKPDLCAPGFSVAVWDPTSSNIVLSDGTSFACPITAGAAALVLQALRDAGNDSIGGWELITVMKDCADQANEPDNDFGWGIPKAPIAANVMDAIFAKIVDANSGEPIVDASVIVNEETLSTDRRGRFCKYIPRQDSQYTITVTKIGYFETAISVSHRIGQTHRLSIELAPVVSKTAELLCYPNPFSDSLKIVWSSDSGEARQAVARVFNGAGELVNEMSSEQNEEYIIWDGTNFSHKSVADGVYVILIDMKNSDGTCAISKKLKVLKVR